MAFLNKKLGIRKYSAQTNRHKTLFYSTLQTQIFRQRKFHFNKMFPQRKF